MHDDPAIDDRIWSLAAGTADPELEAHIATCADCQRTLATMRAVVPYRAVLGGPIQEPSREQTAAVSNLFRRIRPDLVPAPTPNPVERLADAADYARRALATLVFDSGSALQPAGLRGAGESGTRQLVFESELADLDLELSRGDGTGVRIVGQLGMDGLPAGMEVVFSPAGDVDADAVRLAIGADGYFHGTLTSGEWSARVDTADGQVVFKGISL